MQSSNELLKELSYTNKKSSDPGFFKILALEFSDGPETGLAVFASGGGVRFTLIGESKSRFFRAYILTTISGNWLAKVSEIESKKINRPVKLILPSTDSITLTNLERELKSVTTIGTFVAVGTPYMDFLNIAIADDELLRNLNETSSNNVNESFNLVHKYIKIYKRNSN